MKQIETSPELDQDSRVRPGALWARASKKGQFLFAVAVGAVLAIISWQAGILDGSSNIFGGLQESAVSAGGPDTAVAIGAAFLIGASMIVLPCGYPSVFAMPSILSSRERLRDRTTLSVLFVAASALPLAALGVGLAFGGDAILGLLDSMKARMGFAVVLYSLLGIVALVYALSELGLFRLPSLTQRLRGPDMPGEDRPYRRALVLGGTMGAGMGMGCPMPTYYVLLGWVAASANPAYGAIVLGAYGLGRVLPAVGLGGLIVAGMERRRVSHGMTRFRERTSWITNGFLTATGSYLVVLFGGVLLYRWVTL
ncbi:MAG: cytochrome c biogenesis protein CcdA [Acidimicrobiia bacterium]